MSSLGVHVGPLRDGYWHCMGASVPDTVLNPAETSILLGTCWQIFSIGPTASLILGEKRWVLKMDWELGFSFLVEVFLPLILLLSH